MTTAQLVALSLYIVAAVLFLLTGFDIIGPEETDWNLVALGLGSATVGTIVYKYA